MGAQGSTFFRKKFLPDFLSPLLVRTPRCRMYRLMALTTAALWGGDGEGEAISIPWLPSVTRSGFWKCWTLITFFCWRGEVGNPSALLFLCSCDPSMIYLSLTTFQSFYLGPLFIDCFTVCQLLC